MENIACSHEMAKDLNKKVRGQNIIMKLDLSKAYDRVKWSFLHEAMRAFGFEEKWIDLIYRLINNCWYSVKIQNHITGHFRAGCGLRQGDPLSPALFTLVLDVFSRNLKAKIEQHAIQEFSCSRRAKAVSHLLFADDILLFSNGSIRSIKNLKKLLKEFCLSSGQIINTEKCRFFVSNKASQVQIRRTQQIIEFQKGTLPTTYLGLPLFSGRVKAEHFDFVLDKIRRKISGWKAKMLSWGGKLTLINSIINSIPIYAMSVLPVPKKVIQQIQRFTSNFLWNQGEGTRHHWVAWEKITKPIEEGGLNLKFLSEASYFWKSKLAWSFLQNKSLWAKFMNQKYKIGSITSTDSKIWKGLEPICEELAANSFWKIGEGSVSFWGQKWWPMDYISVSQNDLPDDLIKNIWSDSSRKQIYIEALPEELHAFASGIQLKNYTDKLIWKPSEDGAFSSRHFRLHHTHRNPSPFSWWKNFWKNWIPSKCSCFLWKCLNYAVPVDEAVQKMHIPIASKCICCSTGHMESLDHLLLFSDAAKEVWSFLHSIFGMNFSYQNIIQATYIWVKGSTNSQFGCLKVLAFTLTVWEIWKWRNICIFEKPICSSSIKGRVIQQLQQFNFLIQPAREASWPEEMAISSLHIPVNKPQAKRGCWIKWSSHPTGLTMNFHSKSSDNLLHGGFLVRDFRGTIIHSGRWDVSIGENFFLTILIFLDLAFKELNNKGIRLAEIQGEEGKVFHCLQGIQAPPWSCIDLVESARKQCSGIVLKAIVREQNQAAIDLANTPVGVDFSQAFKQSVHQDRIGLARWSWLSSPAVDRPP